MLHMPAGNLKQVKAVVSSSAQTSISLEPLMVNRYTSMCTQGNNSCDFLFTSLNSEVFQKWCMAMGSILKGKNLLPEEQILSFKS